MHLQRRNRILRQSASIRSLVAETILTPSDFIAPLFIDEGKNIAFEIPSMPGYYRYSIDNGAIKSLGVNIVSATNDLIEGDCLSILFRLCKCIDSYLLSTGICFISPFISFFIRYLM